jgi:hypothetical protein
MQLTQIHGANIGKKHRVSSEKEIRLPAEGHKKDIDAPGYIHEYDGQKTLVPHADIPVAINNKLVVSPHPIKFGDTVTINHGRENESVYTVHNSKEKITDTHLKDAIEKSGMTKEEKEIDEIMSFIQEKQKKSFFLLLVIAFLVAFFLTIFGFFIWNILNQHTTLLEQKSQIINELQLEMQNFSKNNKSDSLDEKLQLLIEKIQIIETQIAEEGKSLESFSEPINELKTLIQNNQNYDTLLKKVNTFETLLQSSELGIQAEINTYYQDLKKQCGENECCMNSFQIMLENSYKLAENEKCEGGQKLNRLKCIGSYSWCYNK